MKQIIQGMLILMLLLSIGYCQYRIIHDCGFLGTLKGAEMVWLFGGCK